MPAFLCHIRNNIIRGVLTTIPLALCAMAVFLLYKLIDKRVVGLLNKFVDVHFIPGLGILILLVFLFFIGLVTTNVFGRQILKSLDTISSGIPFIRQIYSLSKQIGDVLGSGDHHVFKRTVLVNFPNAGQWTVALVTGRLKDEQTQEDWLKVYVPMAHPYMGFMCLVREEQVKSTPWSVDQALKMVASFGMLSPGKG